MSAGPVQTEGIVVERRPYGDTSLIVRWLTPELGRISTIAKGARKPKSVWAGQIDLFYHCQLLAAPPRSGDLYQLREAQLQHVYRNLSRDWILPVALQYFGDLIAAVTEEGTALPEEFALYQRALAYLDENPVNLRVVRKFEFVLLEHCGYAPGPADKVERVLDRAHLPVPKSRLRLMKELRSREGEAAT
ncbi:MAG: DNA repair protein RecO [Verrucomicrobiota bacterium]